MSITILGLIVLPLGLYLFSRGHRSLFWATIWSIPFFDTIVLRLPFAPIRPFQYLGGLLILRYVVNVLVRGDTPSIRRSPSVATAGAFLLSLVFSFFAPGFISTPVYVVPEGISSVAVAYQYPKPLQFSVKNITQILYPIFGILLFLTVEWSINSVRDLRRIFKILIKVFIGLAGFMVLYQVAYVIDLQRPVDLLFFLLQGEANANFDDYNALGALLRAFTPAGEPGYTGLYYALVLGLVGGVAFGGYRRAWKPARIRQLAGLILIALVLNASTTGFFALAMLVVGFVLVSFLRRRSRVSAVSNIRTVLQLTLAFAVIVGVVLVVAQVVFGLSLVRILITQHLAKLTQGAGSGAFRIQTVTYSLREVFAASPLLGVGYGSHRALSLLIFLLSNVGVVGTFFFLLLNVVVFRHAIIAMNNTTNPNLAVLCFATAVTHAGILPTLLVAKSETGFSFGWLWLLLGMMEAEYRIYRREKREPVAAG